MFADLEIRVETEVALDLPLMPGIFSVWANSKMDWALSVTGP